jgi:hypothetical protein
MGVLWGPGDGSGRPKGQTSILGLLSAKVSFKKMNFIFKISLTTRPDLPKLGRTLRYVL